MSKSIRPLWKLSTGGQVQEVYGAQDRSVLNVRKDQGTAATMQLPSEAEFPKRSIIRKAAEIIRSGGLVAFPTETVYGLGADAFNQEACLKIYTAKGRPSNNPLIVHVNDIKQAEELAIFSDSAYLLASLWPGPLTIVLPKKPANNLAECVTAGLGTVAIRIPSNQLTRSLIAASDVPIAAPSANKSGALSPTMHYHVTENFQDKIFTIPSLEASKYGLESTIIDLSTDIPTILRFGFITPEVIEQILGKKVEFASSASKVIAPGMMYRHYAPKTPIRINATFLEANEVGLGFGKTEFLAAGSLNLSKTGSLELAAANLFAYLHELDIYALKYKLECIAVARIPNESIGLAINDRLTRACRK